jgi:hypothetical protein
MSTLKVTNIAGLTGSSTDVMEGLAKAWHNFDGTGTVATRDSFNISSLADNGTGVYTSTYTNAFNNTTYVSGGATMEVGSTGNNDSFLSVKRDTNYTDSVKTTSLKHNVIVAAGAAADRTVFVSMTGDLA